MKTNTTIEFTALDVRNILSDYVRHNMKPVTTGTPKIVINFEAFMANDGRGGEPAFKGAKATVMSED